MLSEAIIIVRYAEEAIFPLDEQLDLSRSGFSHELSKQMVWLSALLPYEQCEQVMERIGERSVSDSSIWRQSQVYGEQMRAEVERQRQQVSVERIQLPVARHDHSQRKAVSMDGGMVNIRAEGWRELKVGAVFDVETRLERNPHTQHLDEMAHGVNVHYTAVMGSKDDFKPALWALAVQHDLPTARNRSVVADGALWIWDVAEDICPDGQQVVDWFHAVEHLSEAAHAFYPNPDHTAKRKSWLKTHKDHLYMGRIHQIIAALHQHQRADLALYFERHQRRMQYLEFRENGLPIGSGTVESGVKQYKQRLCGTGMRWNTDTAQRMLVIRSASLSGQFDVLWRKVA
jgi:hypothetical protein